MTRYSSGSDPIISVVDLQMLYGDNHVLEGLDFTVEPGEIVAMLGPNGAGKSTTVEILEGFRSPSSGEVTVLGVDPAHGDDGWRSQIGVVLQNAADHGKWQTRHLLDYIADFYRPYVDTWPTDELLELVGLTDQARQRVQTLSGGQRRRLDVALGIVGRPSLLFLDEPTTGFDPHARREFHELVLRLGDLEGVTILLTTHDLSEAEKLASRILVLAGGRIIADGDPLELTATMSKTSEVRWKQGGTQHSQLTEDVTAFSRELLTTHEDITDFDIRRSTLEDAYLTIVAQFESGQKVDVNEFDKVAP